MVSLTSFFKNINLPPVTFFHSFHVCTELMHTLQCQAAKYVLCIMIPLRGLCSSSQPLTHKLLSMECGWLINLSLAAFYAAVFKVFISIGKCYYTEMKQYSFLKKNHEATNKIPKPRRDKLSICRVNKVEQEVIMIRLSKLIKKNFAVGPGSLRDNSTI